MNKEAFVYLWYDSRSKMFYLGKHKGTPDDGYTHSSSMWQQFKNDNIPKGVRRRIIAWGTNEDMHELETKLLLNRKEKCWDRYYNANIRGKFYRPLESYKTGEDNFWYGKKLTEKTKRKMSKAALGRKHTEETKRKISEALLGEKNPRYGKKHTEEAKRKISKASSINQSGKNNNMYGKKHTEETKRKISESKLGQKFTEETKRKISEAGLGRKHTKETKRKIREAILGRKHTEESKRKMSESRLGKIPWNKGKKYTHNERRT